MAKLGFSFQLQLTFTEPVTRHAFALRCLPIADSRQRVLSAALRVLPDCGITQSADAFGPRQSGTVLQPHAGFSAQAEGVVEVRPEAEEAAPPDWRRGPYRAATPLTAAGPALRSLAEALPHEDAAEAVMSLLAERFTYLPGSTHADTTAEEAARLMTGVCQDEAHIMLALLREKGVPCRYVMGYMLGEGATHAWVEVARDGLWLGYDPTNRRMVNDEYIRGAAGRDANDCPVNRGVFIGTASQAGQSCLSVWREKE